MMRKVCGISLFFCSAVIPTPVPAADDLSGDFRCGQRIISDGMLRSEVLRLCGEPDAIENDGQDWIYDRAPNQFLVVVEFADGVVQFIDTRPKE